MKNKEITIYELIGLIKDDTQPNQIYYYGIFWNYDEELGGYYSKNTSLLDYIKDDFINCLNDKVEILSEENEKQQLIKFLKDKIKRIEKDASKYKYGSIKKLKFYKNAGIDIYQEVLEFVNKGGK